MGTFYTVDRRAFLKEGQQAVLTKHGDLTPPGLGEHAHRLFPEGLSPHGNQYFLGYVPDDVKFAKLARDARTEAYFEAVRAAHYPERPSRLTSMFGSETLEGAQAFRAGWGAPEHPIYEVECARWFKADMSIVLPGASVLHQSYLAHQYWQGKSDELTARPPVWEVLLALPLYVRRRAG